MPHWKKMERMDEDPRLLMDTIDMADAVRNALAPLLLLNEMDGTRYRTVLLYWLRKQLLEKLSDKGFLNKVYGTKAAAVLQEEMVSTEDVRRPIVDGCALAITEAVLDKILKVK